MPVKCRTSPNAQVGEHERNAWYMHIWEGALLHKFMVHPVRVTAMTFMPVKPQTSPRAQVE